MGVWRWLLATCGLLFGLAILYVIVAGARARKHRKDLEADMLMAQLLEGQRQQDPRAGILLIQVYEHILTQLRPDDDPIFYAMIWTFLGTAYRKLPEGKRVSNVERAIACYQEALRFLTPETAPAEYATTQSSLGNAYRDLSTGDRETNVERAIACYQEALRFVTLETMPINYASVQNNLGNAYRDLSTGDRETNVERSIACYQEALSVWTPETAPLDYALVQNNLGNAYRDLSTGDRETNVERAIACYQEALSVWTPENALLEYARTQTNLGLTYRDLSTGDQAANMAQAIACYQEALRLVTIENAPHEYVRAQNNLGLAYRDLPTGERAENLARAITCFQEVLRVWTPEDAPHEYATTQNNLARTYRDLPTGERAENLARQIASLQEVLRVWTPETEPLGYAAVQNNLGLTYGELPTGNRAANMTRAITCFQEALRFYPPQTAPLDYAMAQSNLGNVYDQLPTGDRAANLTQAITCYQEALRFRTPEAWPFDYAFTQNSLGYAYLLLPIGGKATNIKRAITCFQEALRFRTPEITPLEYAVTQCNLGKAYRQLSTGDKMSNMDQAITCFQEALRFATPEDAPLEYAAIQNSLGVTYRQLPMGDKVTNVTRAITCYQEALSIWTPETEPFDYATVQNNLGNAYSDLLTGNRATNVEQAIICYQEALRFRTLTTAPFEYRTTNGGLADLHLAQGEWHAALDAYRAALSAGEQLYRIGLSSESKATEMAQNTALHRHAAFAAVRCGEKAEALLILEQGKTRLLAEALRLGIPRPASVPDEVWFAFKDAGGAVRSVQFGSTAMPDEKSNLIQAYAAREQAAKDARAALDAAIEHVRVHAREFLTPPTAQALSLDEHTRLVAFCITDQGSIGFIVDNNYTKGLQVVEVPNFTQTELRRLLVERDTDGRVVGGWLVDYFDHLIKDTQTTFEIWQATIMSTLTVLGQRLLAPILSTLPPSVERIIFLPSAELFLLPLHAAPLSVSDSELVCDRYQISYAPSIEVLADTRKKTVQGTMPNLYAVINPEADPRLVFTPTEGAAIAGLFAQRDVDEGRAGTKQRVIARVQGRTYVHFSCHGSYDWNDPTESGLDLTDGRLTLADLQHGTVDLASARLVTLSACETGITDVLKGSAEEYVGIPAGFLLAGVPCVVSSLWAVPDLSTALLMERFYRNHLGGGMDFTTALCEAQVWVRELKIGEVVDYAEQWYRQSTQRGKDEKELLEYMRYYQYLAEQDPALHPFAHPYYWAAFTVNGM